MIHDLLYIIFVSLSLIRISVYVKWGDRYFEILTLYICTRLEWFMKKKLPIKIDLSGKNLDSLNK